MTSSNIKITLFASLVILLGGCASGGGGLSAPTGTGGSSTSAGTGGTSSSSFTALPTQPPGAVVPTTITGTLGTTSTSAFPMIDQTTASADLGATAVMATNPIGLVTAFKATSGAGKPLVAAGAAPFGVAFGISAYPDVQGYILSSVNNNQVANVAIMQMPDGTNPMMPFHYQTFGNWTNYTTGTGGWFSIGIPTTTAMPNTGTATYKGVAAGEYISPGFKAYQTEAYMGATADFGKRTITVTTDGTYTTPNATGLTTPSLNLTGTLRVNGNNFAGPISAAGLSGKATGRFYGPGTTTTVLSTASSPAEVGGTYALHGYAGSMIGAFGGVAQ